MPITVRGGFIPGENVGLFRPLATPKTPTVVLETAVADDDGAATFAAAPLAGAHYLAHGVTSDRRVWQLPQPGPPDAATTSPPIWSSVATETADLIYT